MDDEARNQVEYLDTETKTIVRMGAKSKPPGAMNRLDHCAVAWNNTQIVHIEPKGSLNIFDTALR